MVKNETAISEFVSAAEEIRVSGRWESINAAVVKLSDEPGDAGAWQIQVFGGLCYLIFTSYLRMQKDAASADVEPTLLAWRARNLLELMVWALYFARSKENARRIYEDAGRDVIDLFSAFHNWGKKNSISDGWATNIATAKAEISDRATAELIHDVDSKFRRVSDAAMECGLGNMYPVANKFLSKFAHPTAMQIVGDTDEFKRKLQQTHFYEVGCNYFVLAVEALEASITRLNNKV